MVFHKRVARRNPTIINFCVVWTFATIPPEMLFYAGKYLAPAKPGEMLCLLQAATMSGIPPMAAVAYLSVVVHACTVVYELNQDVTVRPFTLNLRMIVLLASPYIAFLSFSIYIAFFGANFPTDIKLDEFFCVVAGHNLSTPVFVFTIGVVLFTLIAQAWIIFTCYQNRSKGSRSRRSFGRSLSSFDMQFVFRMLGFTVFEIVLVVACVASILKPQLTFAKLLLATPPFAVFLVFATSQDILCAWFPWCLRIDSASIIRSKSVLQISRSERTAMTFSRDQPTIKSRVDSAFSQYSQWSQAPMLGGSTRVVSDLEKGIERPPDAHIHLSRDFRVESVETSMQVHSYSSQQNPMDTMRSFKSTRYSRKKPPPI
ncbi:hypothetical protein M422DRAFT_244214 [Sphaerobolus stellatus SS14]|nr:hypothetical protein M422DRAFT_244214 [Sphaerobolus stellatus SS14]